MTIEIPSLGITQQIDDYTLIKELDSNKIKRSFNADGKFEGTAYDVLLEQTLSGKGIEDATATELCGVDEISIQCNIMHNEGTILHRSCLYSKKIFIKDVLTCIKDLEVNIFDFAPTTIGTIQGTKEEIKYNATEIILGFQQDEEPTLQYVLQKLGGIPDQGSTWTVTYVLINAIPFSTTISDPTFGDSEQYAGHICNMVVIYNRITSSVQHSPEWVEIPGSPGTYYFSNITPTIWNAPILTNVPYFDPISQNTSNYIAATFIRGRFPYVIEKQISNSISFNDVVEKIFECTGLSLVSNFFGINSDSSQPNNEVYEYASIYMQDLKIIQSYDIIREGAINDSFGISGNLKAKKFIESISTMFNLLIINDTVSNVLRIEHVSYFGTKGFNFTTNGKEYGLSDEIDVNKELIGSETWRFAALTPSGYETKITYDVLGDAQEKETPIEQIITDVIGTINNPDYEKDEYKKLFYIVQTDGANIIGLNTGMYIANLIRRVHYQNRPLQKGIHDGESVSFTGYSLGMTSELTYEGSLKDFIKLNPGNSAKIANGTWLITKMEYSKGVMKMGIKK